jgi:hypothetical protein
MQPNVQIFLSCLADYAEIFSPHSQSTVLTTYKVPYRSVSLSECQYESLPQLPKSTLQIFVLNLNSQQDIYLNARNPAHRNVIPYQLTGVYGTGTILQKTAPQRSSSLSGHQVHFNEGDSNSLVQITTPANRVSCLSLGRLIFSTVPYVALQKELRSPENLCPGWPALVSEPQARREKSEKWSHQIGSL